MTQQNHSLAVSATGLRKSFGSKTVLDGIGLAIAEGTIFALLGPNGAGKTTTVQILSTLIPADAGEARVADHDVRAEPDLVRAAIGVTGQFSAVDNLLTGRENLLLMADLAHLDRREGRRRAAESARLVRADRRGRQAGHDLLRRHAAPAGPCHDADAPSRGSSSLTSRRPAWIRAAAAACGRSSVTSSPRAPPCS